MIRALALAGSLAATGLQAQETDASFNDYPTAARADYVFGCMAVNGQGRDVLEHCACSIDVIASLLSYEDYVEAETVLSLQQVGGERTSIFRSATLATEIVASLRRAQAEAEILCF